MAEIGEKLIGKTIPIRGVNHICLAAQGGDLLMLQLKDNGEPCQYVVAHEAYPYKDELCWLNGDYFPILMYPDTAAALKDAVECLTDGR